MPPTKQFDYLPLILGKEIPIYAPLKASVLELRTEIEAMVETEIEVDVPE